MMTPLLDPTVVLTAGSLIGLFVVAGALLRAWAGWLDFKRQELDRATLARAREKVAALDLERTYGIVLAEQGWHPGVIGIVASRVVEETGRPVVMVAIDEKGEGKGEKASDTRSRRRMAGLSPSKGFMSASLAIVADAPAIAAHGARPVRHAYA